MTPLTGVDQARDASNDVDRLVPGIQSWSGPRHRREPAVRAFCGGVRSDGDPAGSGLPKTTGTDADDDLPPLASRVRPGRPRSAAA